MPSHIFSGPHLGVDDHTVANDKRLVERDCERRVQATEDILKCKGDRGKTLRSSGVLHGSVSSSRVKRWLLTEYGNSLVEVTPKTRRDAIEQMWKALIKVAVLERRLGYRFLRKTGASAIKRLGGLEESEMYLAHAEPGINKAYANRNLSRMWECLRQLRQQLPFLGESFSLVRENTEPTPPTKRSNTGFRNVSYHAGKDRYYARLMVDGDIHCTGYFKTAEDAAAAAASLRRQLGLLGSTDRSPESI